ncbi:MAG: hypothetical protein ACRDQ5_28990, partial [Sciscionella sp.]
ALVQTNPAAFLPDLAGSLNTLAVRQGEVGDRAGALDSITEAVTIRRALVQINPTAFLPDLAMSLNNLAETIMSPERWDIASDAYDHATASLSPGQSAELLLSRARWHARHHRASAVRHDLARCRALAESEPDPAWAGRARRGVREFVSEASAGLSDDAGPEFEATGWPTDPLPDQAFTTLNAWLSAPSWPEQEAALRAHPRLLSPQGRQELELVTFLYPDNPGLAALHELLAEIADRDLDTVLRERRATHDHAVLLQQWLDTTTWQDSLTFARAHPYLLADLRTLAVLHDHGEDPTSAQHAGIVALSRTRPLTEVYDAVTDPTSAVDLALALLDQGDVDTLTDLAAAAPALEAVPFTGRYVAAIWLVLTGNTTDDADPIAILREAAAASTDVQRQAGAARLRRLTHTHPEHAATLQAMTDLLNHDANGG